MAHGIICDICGYDGPPVSKREGDRLALLCPICTRDEGMARELTERAQRAWALVNATRFEIWRIQEEASALLALSTHSHAVPLRSLKSRLDDFDLALSEVEEAIRRYKEGRKQRYQE